MNNISWFLYWVDVVGSLGTIIGIIGVVGSVLFIVSLLIGAMMKSSSTVCPECESSKREAARAKAIFKLVNKKTLFIFGVIFFLEAFIPSTKTMYLIMGSEVGEEIVSSQTGQRVQDAINKKLDEYLLDGEGQ